MSEQSSMWNGNRVITHERELAEFLDTIHAQLDHATKSHTNEGNLVLPLNDDNIKACKWLTTAPELPDHLARLVPFSPDDTLEIHARYRYGTASAMVNIWLNSVGGEFRTFSLGLRVDPETGEARSSSINQAGSDHLGHIDINEQDARSVMDAIFRGNAAYEKLAGNVPVATAFRLGIATQRSVEPYTVESAGKIFAAYSRARPHTLIGGQFNLEVRATDRSYLGNKHSQTKIILKRQFEPEDYPNGFYSGVLQQNLTIVYDADDRIVDAKRESEVSFADWPAEAIINGTRRFVTLLNPAPDEIPSALSNRLYPDAVPTLEDLAYFQRLVTTPIHKEDLYI